MASLYKPQDAPTFNIGVNINEFLQLQKINSPPVAETHLASRRQYGIRSGTNSANSNLVRGKYKTFQAAQQKPIQAKMHQTILPPTLKSSPRHNKCNSSFRNTGAAFYLKTGNLDYNKLNTVINPRELFQQNHHRLKSVEQQFRDVASRQKFNRDAQRKRMSM